MSDKDMLISMGFEAARVDCTNHSSFHSSSNHNDANHIPGALKATKNSGLQPALDFLFAHTDDPIPDPSAPAAPATSASGGGPMDEDADPEDLEAIQAVYGKANISAPAGAQAGEDVEAKVGRQEEQR